MIRWRIIIAIMLPDKNPDIEIHEDDEGDYTCSNINRITAIGVFVWGILTKGQNKRLWMPPEKI